MTMVPMVPMRPAPRFSRRRSLRPHTRRRRTRHAVPKKEGGMEGWRGERERQREACDGDGGGGEETESESESESESGRESGSEIE